MFNTQDTEQTTQYMWVLCGFEGHILKPIRGMIMCIIRQSHLWVHRAKRWGWVVWVCWETDCMENNHLELFNYIVTLSVKYFWTAVMVRWSPGTAAASSSSFFWFKVFCQFMSSFTFHSIYRQVVQNWLNPPLWPHPTKQTPSKIRKLSHW